MGFWQCTDRPSTSEWNYDSEYAVCITVTSGANFNECDDGILDEICQTLVKLEKLLMSRPVPFFCSEWLLFMCGTKSECRIFSRTETAESRL